MLIHHNVRYKALPFIACTTDIVLLTSDKNHDSSSILIRSL